MLIGLPKIIQKEMLRIKQEDVRVQLYSSFPWDSFSAHWQLSSVQRHALTGGLYGCNGAHTKQQLEQAHNFLLCLIICFNRVRTSPSLGLSDYVPYASTFASWP